MRYAPRVEADSIWAEMRVPSHSGFGDSKLLYMHRIAATESSRPLSCTKRSDMLSSQTSNHSIVTEPAMYLQLYEGRETLEQSSRQQDEVVAIQVPFEVEEMSQRSIVLIPWYCIPTSALLDTL